MLCCVLAIYVLAMVHLALRGGRRLLGLRQQALPLPPPAHREVPAAMAAAVAHRPSPVDA